MIYNRQPRVHYELSASFVVIGSDSRLYFENGEDFPIILNIERVVEGVFINIYISVIFVSFSKIDPKFSYPQSGHEFVIPVS